MNIKNILFLFGLLLYSFGVDCFAQSLGAPYKLHWGLETPILTAGIGLNISYIILDRKSSPLSPNEISLLDRNHINPFDRSASYNWSKPIKTSSDVIMLSSFAYPALLFIDSKVRQDADKVGLIWAQTFILTSGITNLTKVLVKRPRPYLYNPDAPLKYKEERDSRYSFFSGHTSMTSAMCFMTAKVFNDYNPKHKALPFVWAGAAIVPATMGLLRYKAGKHFPSDVIVGYAVGAAVGFLVPHLHKMVK